MLLICIVLARAKFDQKKRTGGGGQINFTRGEEAVISMIERQPSTTGLNGIEFGFGKFFSLERYFIKIPNLICIAFIIHKF